MAQSFWNGMSGGTLSSFGGMDKKCYDQVLMRSHECIEDMSLLMRELV